ncbi:hypothetical protein [Nocardioides sp. AE5]|uniref:MmyB family transcriptional regulator n=1 Tax=Nocardioides sp. AE5 TaxID=2962573 RepID=UPI002881B112|nr:hypothetical protein [Nocardioides sp. AE5]MDT0200451.1 hypothetical protein [Nocardioides sp. AE5]
MSIPALAAPQPIGPLLRSWRTRRRRSQLDVSTEAGISTRPAPAYDERSLDDAEMGPIRDALQMILTGYEPYPALVVDRGWHLVHGNAAIATMLTGVAPELLSPPINVLRVSLHPDGMSSRIVNLAEWRGHILDRLGREAAITGSEELAGLRTSLRATPAARSIPRPRDGSRFRCACAPMPATSPSSRLSPPSAPQWTSPLPSSPWKLSCRPTRSRPRRSGQQPRRRTDPGTPPARASSERND